MKKLIALLAISVFILTGCGSNQIQPVPQPVEQEDDDEMGWFADEVLDMDDWGEKKKSKVKPGVEVAKPKTEAKPSPKPKPKVDIKKQSAKQKV